MHIGGAQADIEAKQAEGKGAERGGAGARAVRLDRLMKHLVPAQLINAGESATRQLAEKEREKPVGT